MFKRSQNQTWNVGYRYFLHIRIKVICIICIKLQVQVYFQAYWQFTNRLAPNQMYEVT